MLMHGSSSSLVDQLNKGFRDARLFLMHTESAQQHWANVSVSVAGPKQFVDASQVKFTGDLRRPVTWHDFYDKEVNKEQTHNDNCDEHEQRARAQA